MAPEHEVAEESVALAHSKIIQQSLGHITGVFKEAGKTSKHLHDLQW